MEAATTRYTFQIVIEKEPDADEFTAYAPRLAGCFRRGKTADEAMQGVRRAIRQRLELLLAKGEPVLTDEKFLRVEELTIEVGDGDRAGCSPSAPLRGRP